MEGYNYSFNLIYNHKIRKIMLLIFETPFIKNNIRYKIENDNLIIKYDNKKIVFEAINKNKIELLNKEEEILITEIQFRNGNSNGEIVNNYKAKREL